MSMPRQDERIQQAIDGLLSPAEYEAFQAEVLRDAKLRAAYVEQVWLHASLRAQRDTLFAAAQPAAESKKPLRRWPLAICSAAVAACATFLLSLAFPSASPRLPAPVATLVQADHCVWAGSDLPTAVNSQLGPGQLALLQGIATLRFQSGALVTIEAPTKIQIVSAMHCRLLEGSLIAEAPESAHGFTVDAAGMKIVDLGTKFGVTAGSGGDSQVRVFEGEVEVSGAGHEQRRLREGKGLTVAAGDLAADQELSRAEAVREDGGWTAVMTAFGRGKDSYARRMGRPPAGAHPLIMVKHTDIRRNVADERRALLTFDVSGIQPGKTVEAQIVLDPEPSGYGFSSLVPDSRFAIYGLTDEALDAWEEGEMRWSSMPGCTDAGPDPAQTRKLAEFWIPRGGSSEPLTIQSPALADFIRTDTNGLVSFLIVRETGESDSSGLVHAFASREHPSARPPTLRIK